MVVDPSSGHARRFRATPKSNVGLRDLVKPRAASHSFTTEVRSEWSEFLTKQASPGINASEHNNIGDAWRHYATAAFVKDIIESMQDSLWSPPFVLKSVLRELLDLTEESPSNPRQERIMDQSNYRAGVDSPGDLMVKDYFIQKALDFVVDVGRGNIKIIDPSTGRARATTPADLPHVPWSDVDRSYTHPDAGDRSRDNTIIA